jgi:RNA polymerase sigma-70 factor (ECF subfamily)
MQSRDDDDLTELICAGLDRGYRLTGLLLGSGPDAEDVVQDACVRAWQSAGSLRERSAFTAWFDRILVNICRDRIRRRGRIGFIGIEDQDMPGSDPFQAVLAHDALLRLIGCLDADERAVVVLHYWSDLPLAEIASRLGWRLGTVKSRLHRALEKMRDEQRGRECALRAGKVASR